MISLNGHQQLKRFSQFLHNSLYVFRRTLINKCLTQIASFLNPFRDSFYTLIARYNFFFVL